MGIFASALTGTSHRTENLPAKRSQATQDGIPQPVNMAEEVAGGSPRSTVSSAGNGKVLNQGGTKSQQQRMRWLFISPVPPKRENACADDRKRYGEGSQHSDERSFERRRRGDAEPSSRANRHDRRCADSFPRFIGIESGKSELGNTGHLSDRLRRLPKGSTESVILPKPMRRVSSWALLRAGDNGSERGVFRGNSS